MNGTMLGSYLRKSRKQKGLTQDEVVIGLFDRSYWSQIERGTKTPPPETLKLIADRLDLNLDTLELLYPGSEYLTSLKKAVQSLESGIIKQSDAETQMQEVWETFARVESTDHMIRCIEEWSKLPSATFQLLEAVVTTVYLSIIESRSLSSLWELLIICGTTYYRLGQFEQASVVYKDIINKHPPMKIATRVHRNLGSTLAWMTHYEEALQHFETMLQDEAIDNDMRAQAHHGMSACFRNLAEHDKSLEHAQIAMELYKPFNRYRCIQCLHTIGGLKLDELSYLEAQEMFIEVESYYKEHDMESGLAELYEEYVRFYFYQNNYEKASYYATKALKLNNHSNPKLSGQLYIWKSWIHFCQSNKQGVLDCYYSAVNLLGARIPVVIKHLDPVHKGKLQPKIDKLVSEYDAE